MDTDEEPFQDSGSEYIPSDAENNIINENSSTLQNKEASKGEFSDGRKNKRKSRGQGSSKNWKRQKNATNRLCGKEYIGFKKDNLGKYKQDFDRDKRKLLPRCDGHHFTGSRRPQQKFECETITELDRKSVFTHFWKLSSWEAKRVYVASLVPYIYPPNRRKTSTHEDSRKQKSFKYFLSIARENETLKKHVCKKMFINTLGIGEKSVRTWVLNSKNTKTPTPPPEGNPSLGTDRQISVRAFLESLPKIESHYCRSSTKKLYLEPIWNSYRHVFKVFCETQVQEGKIACSWRTFLKIFKSMNLEIYSPKKDQCNYCMMFRSGNLENSLYEAHISRKNQAREEKENDKASCTECSDSEKICIYTVDLQAVLLCPILQATAIYFKTKLKVHNWTFFNLNDKDVSCFLWHEANGGLESNVFCSIMRRFLLSEIQKQNPKKIILWSDGCGYQNRNTKLSNCLLELSMEQNITIEQKYLEVGHTQMEVDSIHSTIERKLDRRRDVCLPADYVNIIKSARENPSQYNVVPLTYTDFYSYDSGLYTCIRPGSKAGDACVNDICALQYLPEGNIRYKLKFSDMWNDLPRRPNRKMYPKEHPPLYTSPCAIELSKFIHLQELKLLMVSDYQSFYDNLRHKNCTSTDECNHIRTPLNASQTNQLGNL
nr:unnamed protein product [Callosobruchus chinensis]